MSHHFEAGTGMFVREPSWHRLERAVLPEHVHTWQEAREAAAMTWEVTTSDVWLPTGGQQPRVAPGYQAIYRNDKPDTSGLLAIQPKTYALITMEDTGEVIETMLNHEDISYEALFSLFGGRQVWSVLYFDEPLRIPADPSETYTYMGVCNRFDGQGGVRALPTNVRLQCANTVNHAEMTDGRRVGVTLRHTKNWAQRVQEVSEAIADARRTGQEWAELAMRLASVTVTTRQRDRFVTTFLPKREDMTARQESNIDRQRGALYEIMASSTCEHIIGTAYGLAQAGMEFSDHGRRVLTTTGYIGRQLGGREGLKARSIRTAKQVAGLRGTPG
jgi:phage/plasmid-like protein (TIGR03299 family)